MIVDTHTHVLSKDLKRYPRNVAEIGTSWVTEEPATPESLLERMAGAGIDRAILVQAWGAYAFDNSVVVDAAARDPERFVAVVIVDASRPDAAKLLEQWVRERGAKGVRLFTRDAPGSFLLDDPATFPVWERARALGIPACVQTQFAQIPRLRTTLRRFPDIPAILDHGAYAPLDDGPPYRAAAPLFDLASLPNFALKVTSMTLDSASQGKSTWREFFPRLVERFGASRLVWGSNYPATHDRGLKEQLAQAREAFGFLNASEREAVFGGNALKIWPAPRGRG